MGQAYPEELGHLIGVWFRSGQTARVSVRPVPVDSWRVCHEVSTYFLVGTC